MLERPKRSVCKPTQVRRFLKRDRDERGVASTVGTIMALLVFLTFLTLFTNSYIPVWMLDNERNHMNTVMNQFGEMKGKVDVLSLNAASSNGMTNIILYQTIDLGADGIPVFASPTAGLLSYQPYASGNNNTEVEFQYHLVAGGKTYSYDQIGGGMVQFYAPNRYYAQQVVTYENGAILIRQDDGQVVKAYPSLELIKPSVNSWVNLSFAQVDFVGKTSNQAGTSSVGLNIDLIYLDAQTYLNGNNSGNINSKTWITLTFKSSNYLAWHDYLNKYLTTPGNNLLSTDYDLTYDSNTRTVILIVKNVYSFTFSKAITQISSEVA
jgi:hypothetical protein